ncbi:hypothetical protein [Streptomyces sp. N35]|uniref:hypothetical protein n=1 Tax=Streptomyces sp. N35 TaxID=2795730 RepID=UPI0018F3416F|nr:hypothetical protein [Streptomyces sp. N35]
MSARDQLLALDGRDEWPAEVDSILQAYRAEVLREAEGVASELFDAADERGDRAGADLAEQIADRLGRMAATAEAGGPR